MNRLEHLLIIVSEECGETAQRATKALRFGLNETQPDDSQTNAQRLVYEFNDLVAVMEMLKEEGHLHAVIDREAIEKKKNKVEHFLKYSAKQGALTE